MSDSDKQALLDGSATIQTKMEFHNDNIFNINQSDATTGNITPQGIVNETTLTTFNILPTGFEIGDSSSWKGYITGKYDLSANDEYVMSLDVDKNTFFIGMYAYNENDVFISEINILNNTSSRVSTFTIPSETSYVRFAFECRNANETITFTNIVIEKKPLILTEDNSIVSWDHEDFRYVKDEGWIGQFVARQVTGVLKNIDDSFVITNREFILWLGVKKGNNINWYSLGNFLVTKVNDNEVSDKTTFEALDYTKKFNKIYDDTITYPCTALELAENVCEQCGVELGNDDFLNNDYVISGNVFTNNETCRDVMKAIGKLAFSWVRVDWDNKVYIDFEKETTVDTYDSFDNSKYYELKTQKEMFGPVNKIIIGYSQIEGERTYISDQQSIEENGLCELKIYDNPLVYTQSQRESIINSANDLLGLSYTPLNTLTVGHPWLKGKELISVTDMENVAHTTIPFDRTIQYFGHIKTLIDSHSATKTNNDLAYESDIGKGLSRTEIIVDKQNQTITSVVEQIGDRSEKQTTITQDIDGIASQVQDIPTITTEDSGTGSLTLINLANTKLISLKIHPTDRDILGLFASPLLKVSSNLKTLSRGITFDNLGNTESDVYYRLPDNLYFYNENIYDEFVYDGIEEKIYVTRKVSVDGQGNKTALDTPITEEYTYEPIVIEEGNYNIFMSTYPTAYIYVKAMIKNDYTSSFATSYEVDTKIAQTNRQIELLAEEKVDENQIIAKLNLAVENHQGIIELVGNTVTIESDHFHLTEDGDMECNNATINGNLVTANGVLTNFIFPCETWGLRAENTYYQQGGSFVGFNYNEDMSSVIKSYLNFTVRVPDNFVVVDARIHFRHSPVTWYDPYNTHTKQGSCKNIRIYTASNLGTTGYGAYMSEFNIGGNTPTFTLINDVSSHNFSDTVFETYSTENFASTFNQSGSYNICVMTTTTKPSLPNLDDAYNVLGQHTGILNGELEIIGYMKYNETRETLNTPLMRTTVSLESQESTESVDENEEEESER